MTIEELKVKISADISNFQSAMNQVNNQVGGLSQQMTSGGNSISGFSKLLSQVSPTLGSIFNAFKNIGTSITELIAPLGGVGAAFRTSSAATSEATVALGANAAETGVITNGYEVIIQTIERTTAELKACVLELHNFLDAAVQAAVAAFGTAEQLEVFNRVLEDAAEDEQRAFISAKALTAAETELGVANTTVGVTSTTAAGGVSALTASLSALMAVLSVAMIAIMAIKKLISATTKAASEQITAETKLTTVMQTRMKDYKTAIPIIKDYCSALQEVGVVGDEVGEAGAAQMATYLKSSAALQTLIPAMQDLAVAMNGADVSASDMTSTANMLGKAIANNSLTSLTRAGITFSDEDIAKWKTLNNEYDKAQFLASVITQNVGHMNEAMANTYPGRVQQLSNAFGDLKEQLGMTLQSVLYPVVIFITKIIKGLTIVFTWLNAIASVIFGNRNGLSGGVTAVQDSLDSSASDAGTLSKNLGGAAKNAKKTVDAFKGLAGIDEINNLSKINESTGGGASGGGVSAPSFDVGEYKAPFTVDASGLQEKLNDIKKRISDWLREVKERLESTPLGQIILKSFETLGKGIKDIFDGILTFLKGAVKSIGGIGEILVGIFTGDFNLIDKGWKDLVDGWKLMGEGLKKFFSGVYEATFGLIAGGVGLVSQALTSVGTLIGKQLKSWSDSFDTWLKKTFDVNAITKWSNGINTSFQNTIKKIKEGWNNFKSWFSSLGTKIGDWMGSALKSGINGILNSLASKVNSWISKFNAIISFINKIPGVNLKQLNTISVPKLAKGGITTGPTQAIIGEAGREAVLPLERNTEWMDDLAKKIVSVSSTQGGGTDKPLEITINIGGSRFGKACIKSINEATKQSGSLQLQM